MYVCIYKENNIILGFGISTISGIHWRSWNISPEDMEGLMYSESKLTSEKIFNIISHKENKK